MKQSSDKAIRDLVWQDWAGTALFQLLLNHQCQDTPTSKMSGEWQAGGGGTERREKRDEGTTVVVPQKSHTLCTTHATRTTHRQTARLYSKHGQIVMRTGSAIPGYGSLSLSLTQDKGCQKCQAATRIS